MSSWNLTKIIEKKSKGGDLSADEITYFVQCVVNSENPFAYPSATVSDPCQTGAMCMAIFLQGLNEQETIALTDAMSTSGHVFSWKSEYRHLLVDKHSTGGVGDKVSLIIVPALAALGLKVPMISGRSLGITGGTLDKLECIPGFRIELSNDEIVNQIEKIGCCTVGQTRDLVPADRVLYRCRNLTATVKSIPLVIASIISKKMAEGITALVYDVKFGSGALCKTKEEAISFGEKLVSFSRNMDASALLTSMDAPLGFCIGNSLEVLEAIDCLKGKGPDDLQEVVEELGGELLRLTNLVQNRSEGVAKMREVIKDGRALNKFQETLVSQGVSRSTVEILCSEDSRNILPTAKHLTTYYYSGSSGFVSETKADLLGNVWKDEIDKNSDIDYAAGLRLLKSVGDYIKTGDPWLEVYHNCQVLSRSQIDDIDQSLKVVPDPISKQKRLKSIIRRTVHNRTEVLHVI